MLDLLTVAEEVKAEREAQAKAHERRQVWLAYEQSMAEEEAWQKHTAYQSSSHGGRWAYYERRMI